MSKLLKVIDIFTALMLVKVSGNYSYIKAHPNVLFKYIVCHVKYISIKLSFLKTIQVVHKTSQSSYNQLKINSILSYNRYLTNYYLYARHSASYAMMSERTTVPDLMDYTVCQGKQRLIKDAHKHMDDISCSKCYEGEVHSEMTEYNKETKSNLMKRSKWLS